MAKILVTASSGFPRCKGDPEPRFVFDLSRGLSEKGHGVTVLLPHAKGAKYREKVGKLQVYRFPYFIPRLENVCYDGGIHAKLKRSIMARLQLPFFLLFEWIFTIAAILQKNPVVIHAHWIVPQGFIAAILKPFFRYRLVMTAHAGDVFIARNFIIRFFARTALKKADIITVNSNYTARIVKSIEKKPVEIIPMGVDLKSFSAKSRTAKYPFPCILFVGRLAEKKGLVYLIKAMPAVLNKMPRATLLVIGTGPEKPHLEKLVHELKVSDRVVFLGGQPHDKLPVLYKSADVFVLPSIITASGDTEGLGVVLLEAVAAGCPVIGSNVGGIPDVIISNKTGLLVMQKDHEALASAILKVVKDKKLARRLSTEARKHVKENYSWDSVSDRFSRIFDRLSR